MSGSYRKRRLVVNIRLRPSTNLATNETVNPPFIEGGNEVTLENYRMSAAIKKAGGISMGELQLRIFGLSDSLMNQLATLGRLPLATRPNLITLSAGDENGMGVAFQGTITGAWADFKSAPNVAFFITALAGMDAALAVIPPTSIAGTADVVTLMASFATAMGYTFENGGVAGQQLMNPYFPGTLREQAQACARAAGIDMIIDNQTLIIVPRGGARGQQAPLISAATGLVGYPTFTNTGISATCVYNPNIGHLSTVEVKTDLKPANGRWRINSLTHELDAEVPGGAWFTTFMASEPRFVPIRPG